MITLKPLGIITILLYIHNVTAVHTSSYPIGGLFNSYSAERALEAFKKKFNVMSAAKTIHGRYLYPNVVDSYSTSLELCSFTSENRVIAALIDARPTDGICDTVCLLCNRLNISHLSVGWEQTETLSEDLFTFSYYPPAEQISKAFATLIKDLQWDKFTILYEDDKSFVRLQEVINTWPSNPDAILFKKLDPAGDNRETFKYVFKVARMNYHLMDCEVGNIAKYMSEIIQVENSTEYQSFILTNLDAYGLNFQHITELMANVSALHLTQHDDVSWKDIGMYTGSGTIETEAALVADALKHVEIAIRLVQKMKVNEAEVNPPSLCTKSPDAEYGYSEIAWAWGNDLREALLQTNVTGFTGTIRFDEYGKRTNFKLHYSKLDADSVFKHVGHWDSETNKITYENVVNDRSSAFKANSKIRIMTKLGLPYFTIEKAENGSVIHRGFAYDLMDAIFNQINKAENKDFKFEFFTVEGNKLGGPVPGTKKWDGLIGSLIDHAGDVAIGDITITAERNAVVDFSIPFMSLGISLMVKESPPEDPDMFSFVNPLSLDVWLYLATTYIIVSYVLLICARMCQDDWVNPHPCNQNPESLQNIWSLYNCMWLTMGSIMTQGCDILPRAGGSRWVTGMWWFFAMITTASYTANMSAFIKHNRRSYEIQSVEDLAEQNKISYGAVKDSSTYKFFETSNDTVYSKLWSVMSASKPTVFTNTNEEGRDRVLRSKCNYAFFMESSALEYFAKRNCSLKKVGSALDSKEYGIAFPKNTPLKGYVDNAILRLQEKGILQNLKKKWWEVEDNTANCETGANQEDDDGSVQMKNISGIFYVLIAGGLLGLGVAVVDFMLHARQISVKERITFVEAMASEWRASLNPRELHKLAAPPRSVPPSTATPSPERERSQSRAVSVLRAATSFINFDEIY